MFVRLVLHALLSMVEVVLNVLWHSIVGLNPILQLRDNTSISDRDTKVFRWGNRRELQKEYDHGLSERWYYTKIRPKEAIGTISVGRSELCTVSRFLGTGLGA